MPAIILTAVITFGVLFLIDKTFTGLFRNKQQYKSGLSVRLPKANGIAGILLTVLAALVLITDFGDSQKLMLFAGLFIAALGIGMSVYYMSFGVYYDEESFVYNSFGNKAVTYRYADIQAQKLYMVQGGSIVVELHMADGKTVNLQSKMEGVYPFLDKAFYRWCDQKGIDPNGCEFHDPNNSLWFPSVEE